jgi:hypothetical protein
VREGEYDLELIASIMRQIEAHQRSSGIEINPGALSEVLLTVAALCYQEASRLEGENFSLEEVGLAFGQLAEQRIKVVGEVAGALKPFKFKH